MPNRYQAYIVPTSASWLVSLLLIRTPRHAIPKGSTSIPLPAKGSPFAPYPNLLLPSCIVLSVFGGLWIPTGRNSMAVFFLTSPCQARKGVPLTPNTDPTSRLETPSLDPLDQTFKSFLWINVWFRFSLSKLLLGIQPQRVATAFR